MDKFWINDPSVLYRGGRYIDVIPRTYEPWEKQLNALTRVAIYLLLVAFLIKSTYMAITMAALILLIIMMWWGGKTYRPPTSDPYNGDFVIEAGYYDSNNNLMMGSINNEAPVRPAYSRQEMDQYNRSVCRMPTEDNPFMNPTADEFQTDIPQPCNVDDDEINVSQRIDENFYKNMFMDVSDVFERHNSERQFYTIPPTYPPDQTAFAKWLYNSNDICKVDPTKCTGH